MYKIENQLTWLSELLENQKVDYIIDSGSLLSLIRDKKFFDKDDIDVSICLECEHNFLKLRDSFEKEGFVFLERRKKGLLYQTAIIPKKNCRFSRPIDIKFFQKKEEFRISPTIYSANALKKGLNHKISTGIKAPFYLLLKRLPEASPLHRIYNHFFNFIFSRWGFWRIPSEYLEKTTHLENTKIKIPLNFKEYLKFRYGEEWTIPIKKWNYTRDDGGIVLKNPFKK
jgi:phosphorylcholine metabolism protein LicD